MTRRLPVLVRWLILGRACCMFMLAWGLFPWDSTPAAAQISEGLVAYYPFDDGTGEILVEQTGMGTDGELFNFDFDDQSGWASGQIAGRSGSTAWTTL